MPALFSFSPMGGPLRSPAYSASFKALAVLIVGLAIAWGAQLWRGGHIVPTLQSSGWIAAALAMMAYTAWHILQGITTLDGTSLQQSWMWHKQVALSDLAYAKLIRVPGLDWLIAPRLYTRSFSNKLVVFYAASPQMLAEFQRLAQALEAARLRSHP